MDSNDSRATVSTDGSSVYYGWIVVSACFIGTVVVFGLSYSFGVFFERILTEFGHPRGITSIAFGVQTFTLYIGAVVVGVFVDRYGTRRVLLAGTIVLCTGLLWTSYATSLVGLVIAYGVVTGFGLSTVYVVSYATVPRWFDRRVGFAGGIASAGLGVGMLVVAPVASQLIERTGWRTAFLTLTAATAVLLLVAVVLVRDDPVAADVEPPSHEFADGPSPATTRGLREQFTDVRRIATTPSFVLLFVGWVLIYTTLYVVFVHIVVHGTDLGLSRSVGASVIAIIGLASAVGRIGIGYVADSISRTAVFAVCSSSMGVATMLLPVAQSAIALYAFALVYGLAYGGNGALLSPLTADLFGRANISAIFGLISAAFALSGLVAPYLAGVGHEAFGSYDYAFITAGIAAVLGGGAVAAAGRLRER